jgi:hypothetical protein
MKKRAIFLFIALLLLYDNTYCQTTKDEEKTNEIVETCNEIMKNIYNDIWRIRESYKELKDFGPQNYSDNPEMPRKFKNIKTLRIKNKENFYIKTGFFHSDVYRADVDLFYIFFSTDNRAFGAKSEPFVRLYFKEYGIYLLVYSRSNNNFLRSHIYKIVNKNARLSALER